MTDKLLGNKSLSADEAEVKTSIDVTQPPQHLVEEEYIIGVPLVRPKPEFLSILKQAGASGEIFTRKEIIEHLKNYIGSRQLYDKEDPKVVYCGNDPLGKVFGVSKFEATFEQVSSFLSKHCTPVPDTCMKRKRRLVARPLLPQPPRTSLSQSTSFTIAVCRASPIVTSSTDAYDHDLKRRKTFPSVTSSTQRKSSSSSTESCRKKVPVNQSCLGQSPVEAHQQSESTDGQSQDGKQLEESKSTEGCQMVTKKQRNRKKRRKSGKETGSSPSQASEPSNEPGPSQPKRGTSLSITYGDKDESSYPWYFQLQVQNEDDDQESEILSIQDKTTATVHDSTDDLWFLEEESFAVEVNSDGEFSVEYDVESDQSILTESDISSVRSGQGVLVVCKESDVEFFADYSDSDSEDTEITAADKWTCEECWHVNSPLQRYCDMCWKLRIGWLPDADSAEFDSGVGGFSSSFCSSQEPASQETVKSRQLFSDLEKPAPVAKRSEDDVLIGNPIPVCSENKESSLFQESQAAEVRYSFSNFQRANSSSLESLESKKSDKNLGSKISASVADPCMICLSQPKSASLVHGSSGHQVCCYQCAKRLKRRGKVCPVCRRPIQKVIKNYIL